MPENIFGHLQRQDQERRRHENNAAKVGSQYVTFTSTGVGDLAPKKPVMFNLPFFSEPAVVTGSALARPPDLSFYYLPQITATVLRWERNDRGFFLGAYLAFRVDVKMRGWPTSAPPAAQPVIHHHFIFTGMSYREMSSQVNEAADDERILPLQPPGP